MRLYQRIVFFSLFSLMFWSRRSTPAIYLAYASTVQQEDVWNEASQTGECVGHFLPLSGRTTELSTTYLAATTQMVIWPPNDEQKMGPSKKSPQLYTHYTMHTLWVLLRYIYTSA
jgi:hypothetical protein